MKNKNLKRLLLVLITLSMLAMSIVGCSTDNKVEEPGTKQEKGYSFVDQNDHEVSIGGEVERIVVLQHHTLDILAMLGAQDKVVGVVDKWESLLGDYMKDVFKGIGNLPKPGSLESCNIEEVVELKPDLVIVAAQFDQEQITQLEKFDIPVMTVTLRSEGKQQQAQNPDLIDADLAYTEGLKWAIEQLGKITDTEEKADKLWNTAMENRKYVEEHLENIPENERVRVFIANEKNMTYGSDKYVGTQLERAGL